MHANAALVRTRERSTQRFISVIVDGGSEDKPWHPVAEAFIAHDGGKGVSRSLLVGFTFKRSDAIRFDAGMGRVYGKAGPVTELRAGLTWMI